MPDVVENLGTLAAGYAEKGWTISERIASDAIAEIKRLREQATRLSTAELLAENVRLRALAEKVANAHATYAYAEPNFGVLLSLKQEARAALARPAGDQR